MKKFTLLKRVGTAALASAIVLQGAVMAGAASTSSSKLPATDYSKINTSKKLTINEFQWGPKDQDKDDIITKMINEKFNVDLKVNRVLSAEYQSALNIRIAANEYPDIFRIKANSPTYQVLYEDKKLVNMSTYMDKYNLNNLKNFVADKQSAGILAFKEEDGYYKMPSYKDAAPNAIMLRQDWLDKYKAGTGKDMPATYSELRSFLKYGKDNNLGGNDTVPFTTYWANTATFLWDLADGFYDFPGWGKVDGVWTSTAMSEGFKKMCIYYNQLYTEGLLDKEVFTLNETNAQAKMVSGKAGMYMAQMGRWATVTGAMKDYKLTLMTTPLAGTNGKPVKTQSASLSDPVLVSLKDKNEDRITRVMAILDYLHDEKMVSETLIYGVEGVTFKRDATGKMTYINPAFSRDFTIGTGNMLAMLTDYNESRRDPDPLIMKLYEECTKYARFSPTENFFDPVFTEYTTQLNIIRNDWIAKFVTGSKVVTNDKDYQEYVAEMKKNGYDKVQKVVSDYLTKKGIN